MQQEQLYMLLLGTINKRKQLTVSEIEMNHSLGGKSYKQENLALWKPLPSCRQFLVVGIGMIVPRGKYAWLVIGRVVGMAAAASVNATSFLLACIVYLPLQLLLLPVV